MSKAPFLTVYGHVSIDQIISLKEFPKVNTSVDITDKRRYLGGTGANIATIAASLGVPTAICSYVGCDFPPEYKKLMKHNGLNVDELVEVQEYETSTALIVNNEHNDQVTYFYQGPMGSMDKDHAITGMASRSKMVHFSTGSPEYYLTVMEQLKPKGTKISLDPAQEVHRIWNAETFCRAIEYSDNLFSNQYEMSSMLSYLNLKEPQEIPVEMVIRTKGKDGADIWMNGNHTNLSAASPSSVVDTTGAGDAFRAGFYAGLYRKYSVQKSAQIGSATASYVIESVGSLTKIPTWEQVLSRMEDMETK